MGLSVFQSASPQAHAIQTLFEITLWICAVIFTVVVAALAYIIARYRRLEDREPPQITGNKRIEIAWTVIPILIVGTLFVLTVTSARAVDGRIDCPPDVLVSGHQWWWYVEYPASQAITANEIHIPVGKNMLFQIDAADVIHDFWVPRLGRKIDAIPGKHNYMWIRAEQAGVYDGACAEYCGAEHAWMRFRVIAEDPASYNSWLSQQSQSASQFPTGDAALGAKRFTELTCSNCHSVRGVNPENRFAPDLTHLASRKRLAAERLPNTSTNLADWLREPGEIKPGSLMPNLKLSSDDVRVLTAYLESLK